MPSPSKAPRRFVRVFDSAGTLPGSWSRSAVEKETGKRGSASFKDVAGIAVAMSRGGGEEGTAKRGSCRTERHRQCFKDVAGLTVPMIAEEGTAKRGSCGTKVTG